MAWQSCTAPNQITAPDPLGSSRGMAVMLAIWGWELPADLLARLPMAQPVPDGAEVKQQILIRTMSSAFFTPTHDDALKSGQASPPLFHARARRLPLAA